MELATIEKNRIELESKVNSLIDDFHKENLTLIPTLWIFMKSINHRPKSSLNG